VNLRVQDRLAERRETDSIWVTEGPLLAEEARVFTSVVFTAKAELSRETILGTPVRYANNTKAAFKQALTNRRWDEAW
jgi:hypothetical protein